MSRVEWAQVAATVVMAALGAWCVADAYITARKGRAR